MNRQKLPQQVSAKHLPKMFQFKKIFGGKMCAFLGGSSSWAVGGGQVWSATGGKEAAAARLTGLLTNWQGPASAR